MTETTSPTKLILKSASTNNPLLDKVYIKQDAKMYAQIMISSILMIRTGDKYCTISLDNKKQISVRKSLNQLSNFFTSYPDLMRIHQSHIVNVNKITKFSKSGNFVLLNGEETRLDVGREYRTKLFEMLPHL